MGLGLSAVIIRAVGGFLEQNMSAFFPVFRLTAAISLVALAIAVGLGILSAAVIGEHLMHESKVMSLE